MKYLVIFATETGYASMIYKFKQELPTEDEMMKIQKEAREEFHLVQIPVIINLIKIAQ